MSFPRYPKYKDSGIEWLGEVPERWEVMRLKHIKSNDKNAFVDGPFGSNLKSEHFIDDGAAYVIESGFATQGRLDVDDLKTITLEHFKTINRSETKGGDIIIAKIGAQFGKSSILPKLDKPAVVSGNSLKLTINQQICDVKFVNSHLRNLKQLGAIDEIVDGTAQPALSLGEMNNLPMLLPPRDEQEAIVTFLDRETAKTDGLVAEQRRLIELLKEKRQAVISHAVTKGLDPHAPMTPSGIEWLGDVPEHWRMRRLSSLSSKITNGYVGPTRDIFADEGVRYLQSLHIKGNCIQFDVRYFVSEEWSNRHEKSILQAGDVLIVQTGDIGQAAVVTGEFAGCNCHALIVVAPLRDVVSGEWISWSLNSEYGFHTLRSIQTGALHPHLNCGDVKDIWVPVPPSDEQRCIVEYILQQIGKLDDLTSEAERAIELLKERGSALISSAVTGKIDVRGLVETVTA